MYDNISTNDLVQMASDVSEQEAKAIYLELAKRYREGIGVEADQEEAEYWEQRTGTQAPIKPGSSVATQVTCINDGVHQAPSNWEMYEHMSAAEVYRAYREKNPGGMYGYARFLEKRKETKEAVVVFEELIQLLEQEFSEGFDVVEHKLLLAKAKMALGASYVQLGNAERGLSNIEDAVLELNYTDGLSALIDVYKKDGLFKHIHKILPVLEKMSGESITGRSKAADLYEQLDMLAYSAANHICVCTDILRSKYYYSEENMKTAALGFGSLLLTHELLRKDVRIVFGTQYGLGFVKDRQLDLNINLLCEATDADYSSMSPIEKYMAVPINVVRRDANNGNLWALLCFATRAELIGDGQTAFQCYKQLRKIIESKQKPEIDADEYKMAGDVYFCLSKYYENGTVVPRNMEQAFHCTEIAAIEYGHHEAVFVLAKYYLGHRKNIEKACQLLDQYADTGDVISKIRAASEFYLIGGRETKIEIRSQEVLIEGTDQVASSEAYFLLYRIKRADHLGNLITLEYLKSQADQGNSAASSAIISCILSDNLYVVNTPAAQAVVKGSVVDGIVLSNPKTGANVDLGRGCYGMLLCDDKARIMIGDIIRANVLECDPSGKQCKLKLLQKTGEYDYVYVKGVLAQIEEEVSRLIKLDSKMAIPREDVIQEMRGRIDWIEKQLAEETRRKAEEERIRQEQLAEETRRKAEEERIRQEQLAEETRRKEEEETQLKLARNRRFRQMAGYVCTIITIGYLLAVVFMYDVEQQPFAWSLVAVAVFLPSLGYLVVDFALRIKDHLKAEYSKGMRINEVILFIAVLFAVVVLTVIGLRLFVAWFGLEELVATSVDTLQLLLAIVILYVVYKLFTNR